MTKVVLKQNCGQVFGGSTTWWLRHDTPTWTSSMISPSYFGKNVLSVCYFLGFLILVSRWGLTFLSSSFFPFPPFLTPSSLHYFPLCLFLSCPSCPQLKEFIQSSGVGAGPAWPRALEIVEGNVRWHRLHRRQFYQWLRKPPNLG